VYFPFEKLLNCVKTASVKLYLSEEWEPLLKEDMAYDIKLYWKVYYDQPSGAKTWGTSPPQAEKENYLKVEFSDQPLFF